MFLALLACHRRAIEREDNNELFRTAWLVAEIRNNAFRKYQKTFSPEDFMPKKPKTKAELKRGLGPEVFARFKQAQVDGR